MLKIIKAYEGSITSRIDNVGKVVRDVMNNIMSCCGPLEECTVFELTVVLNELVLNAVKHGNKEDESKRVEIRACITEDGFACFTIKDEGCGYDYKCHCSKTDAYGEGDICSITESGRGILIVRSLCDQVKVNSKGNKIVVMKKLS